MALVVRAGDLYPVFISSNFERVFGIAEQRIIDDIETLLRFVPDDQRIQVKRILGSWDKATILELEFPYDNSESVQEPASSSPRFFRGKITPLSQQSYFFASLTDVTEETRALRETKEERDSALQLVEGRTDFMSQMSHEIRTPLNGIKGVISLALEHIDEKERLTDDLSRAVDLSDYLLSLVNDVLDMSRLNSNRVELELLPFDIRLVAKELSDMFIAQATEKGLNYHVSFEGGKNVFLVGDRMRLNQIIINFISNALKFTDSGGNVTVTIREMYQSADGAHYMIKVRDTGKGMDPRFIGRIFKPFEQEDSTIARRYGGTGLGMAITNALVNLMNGEIVVDTELGKGSDFTVYLPFSIATQEQIVKLATEKETLETYADKPSIELEYDFEGKRFLMAEDNDLNAMITMELLGHLGAHIDRASDGGEAVDLFASQNPGIYDAILMDIQMPTMNGLEATRRIRALERDDAKTVPIIALSANNYAEDARASREAGMNGHTGKPIDMEELKAQLAAATAEAIYGKGTL